MTRNYQNRHRRWISFYFQRSEKQEREQIEIKWLAYVTNIDTRGQGILLNWKTLFLQKAGRRTVHVNSEFLFALAFVQTVKANVIPRWRAVHARAWHLHQSGKKSRKPSESWVRWVRLGFSIRAEIEKDPSANQVIAALVLFLLGPLESHHDFFPPSNPQLPAAGITFHVLCSHNCL